MKKKLHEISLGHFIKHNPLISEEWQGNLYCLVLMYKNCLGRTRTYSDLRIIDEDENVFYCRKKVGQVAQWKFGGDKTFGS